MASVEMKVHRSPVVPAILAVLGGLVGAVVGTIAAILAWQGPGGGCLEWTSGGPLEVFYPAACNTAWHVGFAMGALAGVGAVLWATAVHRRGRSTAFGVLAGVATALGGAVGLYGGIYLGAGWMQQNGLHGDPGVLWLFGIAGVVVGMALGAGGALIGRRPRTSADYA